MTVRTIDTNLAAGDTEDQSMLRQVVGDALAERCSPADVRIDMPVAVEFHEIEDGVVLPYFAPAHSGMNG